MLKKTSLHKKIIFSHTQIMRVGRTRVIPLYLQHINLAVAVRFNYIYCIVFQNVFLHFRGKYNQHITTTYKKEPREFLAAA